MKTRVIVAAVLLPLLLIVVLVLPTVATAILLAAMGALAVWELLYATGLVRHMRLIAYSAVMAAGLSFWSWLGCPHWLLATLMLLYFTALAGELLYAHTELEFSSVALAAFAGIVVPGLLTALVRLLVMENGRFWILVPFIIAFSADSGAYFAGRMFGKRKLAPVISPKKTVEGVLGGIASAVVMMLIYAIVLRFGFRFRVNFLYAALYAILGSCASVMGDLTFSVIKRQTHIKDYGKLLPGHGGILDRFDSMCMVAPLVETLMLLLPFAVRT